MCALAQQTPEGMAASLATLSSRSAMPAVSVKQRDNFPFSLLFVSFFKMRLLENGKLSLGTVNSKESLLTCDL